MSKEVLEVKLRLMSQALDVGLDLEENNLNEAENKMFYINEDLALLEVIAGEDSTDFKEIERMESSLKAKLATAKKKKGEYI